MHTGSYMGTMHRRRWRIAALLMAGCCLWFSACEQGPRIPSIVISADSIDLGQITAGEIRTASITIINGGSDTLRIVDIQASCGCTKVNNPSMNLAPGSSDELEVSFNSRGFSGKTVKRVSIKSNDPVRQQVVVTLLADIFEELKLISHPGGVVNLGKLDQGKTHVETVSLKNMTGVPLRVMEAQSQARGVEVSMAPSTLQPGQDLDLELRVTPEVSGIRQQTVTLTTDSRNQPRVSLKVVFSS